MWRRRQVGKQEPVVRRDTPSEAAAGRSVRRRIPQKSGIPLKGRGRRTPLYECMDDNSFYQPEETLDRPLASRARRRERIHKPTTGAIPRRRMPIRMGTPLMGRGRRPLYECMDDNPKVVSGTTSWTEAIQEQIDKGGISPRSRPRRSVGQFYEERDQQGQQVRGFGHRTVSECVYDLQSKLRTVGASPLQVAENSMRVDLEYDDGSEGFADIHYFDAGEDEVIGVVKLDSGETITTQPNPSTDEVVDILQLDYPSGSETFMDDSHFSFPVQSNRFVDDVESELVSAAQARGEYRGHTTHGNTITWSVGGQDINITATTLSDNGKAKINIDGEVMIADIKELDAKSLAEAILMKLGSRKRRTVGYPSIPSIHPDISKKDSKTVGQERLFNTDAVVLVIDSSALEMALRHAREEKDDAQLQLFADQIVKELGNYGQACVHLDSKKANLVASPIDVKKKPIVLNSSLFWWLCEWSREYCSSVALLKKLVQVIDSEAKKTQGLMEPLLVAQFPALVQKAEKKSTRKTTKKTKSTKKKAAKTKKTAAKKKVAKKRRKSKPGKK